MVYGVAYLVSYLSQFMSLQPGDIIRRQLDRRRSQRHAVRAIAAIARGHIIHRKPLMADDKAARISGGDTHRPLHRANHRHTLDIAHRQLPAPIGQRDHQRHRTDRAGDIHHPLGARHLGKLRGRTLLGISLLSIDLLRLRLSRTPLGMIAIDRRLRPKATIAAILSAVISV